MAENSVDDRNKPEALESIGTKFKKVEVIPSFLIMSGNLPLSTLDDECYDR